jgi:broad specificity phosphatase PhoE
MKYIEMRRHTLRATPGPHLTQSGVNLARRLGEQMGPFALVVTSLLPRAYETAIAMGFAVHEQRKEFGALPLPETVEDYEESPASFARWAEQAAANEMVGEYVRRQARALRDLLDELDDGEAALVISHGGIVEAGAVGCLPQFDWALAGGPVSYCEGVHLTFEGAQCIQVRVLRV